MRIWSVLTLLLCVGHAIASPDAALYRRAHDATFEVLVDGHLNGSGVVVDAQGWAFTANHVLAGATQVELRSSRLARVPAQVVAIDRGHDLALLRLPPARTPYATMPLSPAEWPTPGSKLHLMGNPIYRHGVMLTGHMARATPTFEFIPDQGNYVRILHVSAPSPPGTSGGPWFDTEGRVVGLQSAMMQSGSDATGIAYMVPVDALTRLLLTRVSASTATLGMGVEEIWEQPSAYIRQFPSGTEGLMVAVVNPESPASRAGLLRGDLITHLEGHPVRIRDELVQGVRFHPVGTQLRLRVLRPMAQPSEVVLTSARLEP